MISNRQNPAADEARGAPEAHQLGGKVASQNSLPAHSAQAIHGQLIGVDTCSVVGITVRGDTPVFTLCHRLLAVGHDASHAAAGLPRRGISAQIDPPAARLVTTLRPTFIAEGTEGGRP